MSIVLPNFQSFSLSPSSPKDGNKVTSTSSNHLVCDKQKKTHFFTNTATHTLTGSAHTLSLDRLYAAAAEQTVVGNPNSAAAGSEYFSM